MCKLIKRPIAALLLHRLRILESGVARLLAIDDVPEVRTDRRLLAFFRHVTGLALLENGFAILGVRLGQQRDDFLARIFCGCRSGLAATARRSGSFWRGC